MKPINDQRKLYLLAAVLLALSVVLCLVWKVWEPPKEASAPSPTASPETTAEATILPDATTSPVSAQGTIEGGVRTTVYYQDNYGYLVPVEKTIAEQTGVAKATLALMVSSPRNDMEAARLGLRTVIPEGTELDLDISKGNARINLTGDVSSLPDAQAEANMVSAIVQTLTEFDSVETVSFLINGRQAAKLPHGTSVSGVFSRGLVNLESASASLPPEDAQTVMLYFPGDSASVIVPVTRMVYGQADVNTAVLELLKGPSAQSPLENALPSGCGLIDATLKDGVVTINFTSDFIKIAEESDGGRMALRALSLTCSQFPGVERVEIQVEGKPYDAGLPTSALPTFVNSADEINENRLLSQSAQLFELE